VNADQETVVAYTIDCVPLVGDLRVNVSTTGVDADPDGYEARLDGDPGTDAPVGIDGSVTFFDVSTGSHPVTLVDVADNCEIDGPDSKSTTVLFGVTVDLDFDVTCQELTGSVQVNVTTGGDDQDTQYTATLSGGQGSQSVPANGSTTFTDVPTGGYTVTISGIALNCTDDDGDDQEAVTVTANTTANAGFSYTCTSTTGSIDVDVSTSGADQDPDGYTFTLDGGTPRAVGINGSTTYSDLSPGDYDVGIDASTVADNCTVNETNPHMVSVTAANSSNVSLTVTCEEITGSIMVTTSTTGIPDPDGYLIALNSGTPAFIDDATPVVFDDLSPTSHDVELSGLDGICVVAPPPPNPATPTVVAGDTVSVDFVVVCL
jgi:hypothetical protein